MNVLVNYSTSNDKNLNVNTHRHSFSPTDITLKDVSLQNAIYHSRKKAVDSQKTFLEDLGVTYDLNDGLDIRVVKK